MNPDHPPIVLTLAGHDPSGGAGIQADLETLMALGCKGASAITCLTVQDSQNVQHLEPVEAELFTAQAEAVLDDYPVAAIKIGLIGSDAVAGAIRRLLQGHPGLPVVLDPVLATGGGTELGGPALVEAMRDQLFPLCSLITPNSLEARTLSGEQALPVAAEGLLRAGAKAVLITGTHEQDGDVTNTLYRQGHPAISSRWPRLPESYHGSGCTLASAVAAGLARGEDLESAVTAAQAYTWQALKRGYRPGRGQYLPWRVNTERVSRAE